MKYRYAIAIALAAITATAFSKDTDKSPVFATVNGQVITTKEFDSLVNMMSNGQITADKLTPEQKKMVMDRLIVIHAAAAEAIKDKLDKEDDTIAALRNARLQILS